MDRIRRCIAAYNELKVYRSGNYAAEFARNNLRNTLLIVALLLVVTALDTFLCIFGSEIPGHRIGLLAALFLTTMFGAGLVLFYMHRPLTSRNREHMRNMFFSATILIETLLCFDELTHMGTLYNYMMLMELNSLHRQDRIVKITGRPVLYFDKDTLERLCGESLGRGPCQFAAMEECVGHTHAMVQGPFDRLIGSDRSLKKQVEQAKAAILYPPDGLHTLIVGQTGVGKTLFAHMMFEYGKAMSFKEGKRQITGAVSVNDEDVASFKALNDKGIELEIRKVNTDKKVMLMDVLK